MISITTTYEPTFGVWAGGAPRTTFSNVHGKAHTYLFSLARAEVEGLRALYLDRGFKGLREAIFAIEQSSYADACARALADILDHPPAYVADLDSIKLIRP
jgi:hypothetical protein